MYRLYYILRQSFVLIKQSKKIVFITIIFLIIGMLTLGSTYIIGEKLFRSSLSLKEKVYIHVFFKMDATYDEIKNTVQVIENIEGIKTVQLITNEQAKQEFLQIFPQYRDTLEALKRNPLPYSADIELNQLEQGTRIESMLRTFPTIDSVIFSQETARKLDNLIRLIWMLFVAILIVVSAEFAFTIQSSTSFLVDFRKNEIRILKLIGADRAFIELPFLILSFVFTLISWIASTIILSKIDSFSNRIVQDLLPFATVVNTVNLARTNALILVLGIIVCTFGSLGPLRRVN